MEISESSQVTPSDSTSPDKRKGEKEYLIVQEPKDGRTLPHCVLFQLSDVFREMRSQ